MAFALQEENGHFYLGVMPQVDDKEPLLRIETDNPDGRAFILRQGKWPRDISAGINYVLCLSIWKKYMLNFIWPQEPFSFS